MKRKFTIFITFTIVLFGCIKKNDFNFSNLQFTNWKPDWALPFLSSSLTLQNMLNTGTLVSTDPNTGLLSLHYSGKGFSFKAADVIHIPDLHFNSPPVTLSTYVPSIGTGSQISDSMFGNFNYSDSSGSQLSKISLKSGNIHMVLSSTYNQDVSLKLIFPNITKDGSPLSLQVNITDPQVSSEINADITGYLIDMTNGGTTRNYLGYKVVYTLTGTGKSISTTSSLSTAIDFTGLNYNYILGRIGNFNVPINSDSIKVGVLNKSIAANIKLLNPKLNLTFTSTFGVSVSANFDSIYSYVTAGSINNIVIPALNILGETNLNQPPVVSHYIIDSTNSTLRNIFSPVPNVIVYNGHVSLNSGSAADNNFITDTSSIRIDVDAEFPACFQIVQLALVDTIKMLMPPDTALLTNAQFLVQVTNAFPVYASAQIYFTDSNYVILDSLVKPNNELIAPAPVDGNGIVKDSSVQITNFVMEHNRYMAMASKISYGIIRGNLYTSGTGSIQLHGTDHLRVKTAFRFTLNYSF